MDAEGATSQITHLTDAPSSIEWSPDGKWIAFQKFVPTRDDSALQVSMPAPPKGAKWTEPPRVVDDLVFQDARGAFREDGYRHIFVVSADGGMPKQVTNGDFDHDAPLWLPDSRRLVFAAARVPESDYFDNPRGGNNKSEIYVADVTTGELTQLTHREGPDSRPRPSPDGRHIAFYRDDVTDDVYWEHELWVMRADGSNPRAITANLDRSPQRIMWASDGSGVYFNVSSEGTTNLFFASLDGNVKPVTSGKHVLRVSDVRNGQAVGTLEDSQHPADVVAFDLRSPQQRRRLTGVNDALLAGVTLGEVEEIWYTSFDGLRIQGWIVKPPDFDPRHVYPLMLSIHGGPHGAYDFGFSFEWQEHAANGYVVLYTNPRGSSGYGSEFGNAIKWDYPNNDFHDLMAGVDTVIGRGYIDTRNMFVYGCSGGGVLTSWVVGHTDRFAAASADCPVTNWISFGGTSDFNLWGYRRFEKAPWEDPQPYLEHSPLMYAGNVKTPTMLMTGVLDKRTPMGQTEEFYIALKARKVPTLMVQFNDEGHGTASKPSNFLRTQLYHRAWFEKFMTKPQREVPPEASN